MHNRAVSYFEECLTSGGLRFQEERRALYKYLLEINNDFYIVKQIYFWTKEQSQEVLQTEKQRTFLKIEELTTLQENWTQMRFILSFGILS